jgi:hypothetical protein
MGVTWIYKNITIRTYSKDSIDIVVDGIALLLSDKEVKFLVDSFLPKQKERMKNNKIALEKQQQKALNSISFNNNAEG